MARGENHAWGGGEGKGRVCYMLVKKQREERKGSERTEVRDDALHWRQEAAHDAVGNGAHRQQGFIWSQ